MNNIADNIEQTFSQKCAKLTPIAAGHNARIYTVKLADGSQYIAKQHTGAGQSGLSLEGWMLQYLREHSSLPVPEVYYSDDSLLLMEKIPDRSSIGIDEQEHAAKLVAALHSVEGQSYGLERDTLIGPLHQPNTQEAEWVTFFARHRLLYMAECAAKEDLLPTDLLKKTEQLCERLDGYLEEPDAPRLIHGDMWAGNVLCSGGRISGFIDPAIYYADPEIELAFTTMFGTFGSRFFAEYQECRPIKPGFFEVRKDIYLLYPLLVHVRIYGGSYVPQVKRIISRLL
jgi:fructosamine-3-kinase